MKTVKTVSVLALAACALAVGGCQKKASGQVVAVVNGEEITQQQLNADLAGVNLPPNVDKKAVQSQVLQQVIDRQLLVAKAKAQGLDQSPTYLDQVRKAQEGILINLLTTNIAKGLPLPGAAQIDKFIADNPAMFAQRKNYGLDQIAFPGTNDQALIAKLKAAHSLGDVEAALTASKIQFVRGTGTLDTATIPPQVAAQIATLPPGEPFLVPQNNQIIASVVKSVESQPLSAEQARPIVTNILRRQAAGEAMSKLVKDERGKAKIEYQSGFTPPKPAAPGAAPKP